MNEQSKTPTFSLALWLAAVAVVVAALVAWYAFDAQQKNRAEWAQWQARYHTQQEQIANENAKNLARLKALQDQVDAARQEQENWRAIIAGGAERFADAQRMHAAEYFIFEAEKILTLAQDVAAAAKLLETADSELAASSHRSAQQLRVAVQRDRQQLQGLAHVDALALARQLSDMQFRVERWRGLAPQLKAAAATRTYDPEQDTWWGQFKANVAQFSGDWFLVREHAHDVEASLSEVEARQVKQAIILNLANAQGAALRHQQGLYYNAVNQAYALVSQHYGSDSDAVAVAEQLQLMMQKVVSVTATISLTSAQALREEKPVTETAP